MDKKLILVITHEGGFSEEQEVKPQKGVETTITKDYKKGKQITETEIKITPLTDEMIEKFNKGK